VQADPELECDFTWESMWLFSVPEVRCQVSDTEDDPILGGTGEHYLGRHLYSGKCRVNFNGKEELKGLVVESSEPVVCRECSQEFHIVEALDLPWKPVCLQPFSPSILEACLAS